MTLTAYADGQTAAVAFPPADVAEPIAQAVSAAGLQRFHAAETEEIRPLTYFFNGGRRNAVRG
ncbi:MAG: hypothetical protein U0470_06395 [Anaerolineae bacterium]